MEKMDDTEKVLENNANSDINFDTSVLQEKNETYSSLTDTYGIDLFLSLIHISEPTRPY